MIVFEGTSAPEYKVTQHLQVQVFRDIFILGLILVCPRVMCCGCFQLTVPECKQCFTLIYKSRF